MNKVNKILILMQILLLNLVCQSIIQCAARIQTKEATKLDIELIKAAKNGDRAKVEELIKQGANVNAVDKYGWTALMWASIDRHKEIVELLIKGGVDVNAANINGNTALMVAACFGYKERVELLLKAGANIEHKNKAGAMAIDLAKNCYYYDIFKMLENEQSRREAVVKKWIKENLAKKITESTSALLIADISNLISEYALEYTDLPLEDRLAS